MSMIYILFRCFHCLKFSWSIFCFQSLARLLFDTKEANKSLKFEVEDLKQKLHDAEGDIKVRNVYFHEFGSKLWHALWRWKNFEKIITWEMD